MIPNFTAFPVPPALQNSCQPLVSVPVNCPYHLWLVCYTYLERHSALLPLLLAALSILQLLNQSASKMNKNHLSKSSVIIRKQLPLGGRFPCPCGSSHWEADIFVDYVIIEEQTGAWRYDTMVPLRTSLDLCRPNEQWIVSSDSWCGYVKHHEDLLSWCFEH